MSKLSTSGGHLGVPQCRQISLQGPARGQLCLILAAIRDATLRKPFRDRRLSRAQRISNALLGAVVIE